MEALRHKLLVPLALFFLTLIQCHLIGNPETARTAIFLLAFIGYTQFKKVTPRSLSLFSLGFLFLFYDHLPMEFVVSNPLFESQRFVALTAVLGGSVLLSWLSSYISVSPLLFLSVFYIAIPFGLSFVHIEAFSHLWLFFSHFAWYFVFLFHDEEKMPTQILQRIAFLLPSPQMIAAGGAQVPLLLGPTAFNSYETQEEQSLLRERTVRFLALNLFLLLGVAQCRTNFPVVFDDGFSRDFFLGRIEFGTYLLRGVCTFFVTYGKLIATMNLCVGFMRMGGVRYPAASSPAIFHSKDFLDFFGSFLFYIKETYLQLFYYPTFLAFRNVRSLKIRIVLSTLISLSLGGVLYHAGNSAPFDASYTTLGPVNFLVYHPSLWMNSLLIALAVLHSQLGRIKKGNSEKVPVFPAPIRFTVLMSLFLITYFVETWPSGVQIGEIFRRYGFSF